MKMFDYITQNLDKYENESKMLEFLEENGLPGSLDSVISTSIILIFIYLDCISDSMWRRIQEIQLKGGSNYIINQLNEVDKSREKINKRITELDHKLQVSQIYITN